MEYWKIFPDKFTSPINLLFHYATVWGCCFPNMFFSKTFPLSLCLWVWKWLWLVWLTVGRHGTLRLYRKFHTTTSQPPCRAASWISSTFRKQGASAGALPPCWLKGWSSPRREMTIKMQQITQSWTLCLGAKVRRLGCRRVALVLRSNDESRSKK